MKKPLCFVLMPFGQKLRAGGGTIDFDKVYEDLIKPSIEAADLEPLRADEEVAGGIIHKPMYERLMLCEYAVADLTSANANVFYELGVRHAVRPASTVTLFAKDSGQLPFDLAPLRAIPYPIGSEGKPINTREYQAKITQLLREARKNTTDSPIYQMVEGFPDIQRLKTDVFRDRVTYSTQIKQNLTQARKKGLNAIRLIEQTLSPIEDAEAGVVIDLFLSYRSIKSWDDMIQLVQKMAKPLAETVMVQEQLGLALNRADQSDEAEQVLVDLITKRGPSSETYGILGRVYKDRWNSAIASGNELGAKGFLNRAIDSYLKGFETDWRDAYPGINAVTLMEIGEPSDPRKEKLIPVIAYAVERRIAQGQADYWDFAILLELAVLANNTKAALNALVDTLAHIREPWESETTANNIHLIYEARKKRSEDTAWISDIETELLKKI